MFTKAYDTGQITKIEHWFYDYLTSILGFQLRNNERSNKLGKNNGIFFT